MYRALALLLFVPIAAFSEEVLSVEQFQAFVQGKTVYYAQQGRPYGAEQYLPGQKTIWQYSDGTCSKGIWYVRKQLICFLYEGDSEEQCWQFLNKDGTFAARAAGREPEADLDVVWTDEQPIACKAPGIGV